MKKILAALLMSAMLTVTACSGQPQGVSESSANSTDSVAYGETAEAGAEKPQRPDISGLTSQEIVSSMTIGWNLGDTLDACQADRDGDGVINEHVPDGEEPDETLWGNPKATP